MYVNGSHRIKLVKLFPPVPWEVSQFVRTVKAKDYFELVKCQLPNGILHFDHHVLFESDNGVM